MSNNRICSECGAIIPLGKTTCPSCYSMIQKNKFKTEKRPLPNIQGTSDMVDTGIMNCLLDISFDKYVVLSLARIIYIFCIILYFILIAVGMYYTFSDIGIPKMFYGETRSNVTVLCIFLSVFVPTLWLLFARASMEFAIAVIKTAENTSKILQIVKRIE
jgi:hypothetical protein